MELPCALVFGYDLASQREREVWRWLARDSFPNLDRWAFGLIVKADDQQVAEALADSLAPSLHAKTAVVVDPERRWPERVSLHTGQVLGLCLPRNGAGLLMIGVPTGEAWEVFRDFARGAFTS